MPREYIKDFITRSQEGWTRDIILADDFENGIIPWFGAGNAGGAIASDATVAWKNAKSLKITTGAVADDQYVAGRNIPQVDPKQVELSIAIPAYQATCLAATIKIQPIFRVREINVWRQAYIGVIISAGGAHTIEYSVDGGAHTVALASNQTYTGASALINMRLVMNMRTGKYIKLEYGGKIFDMSALNLYAPTVSGTIIDGGTLSLSLITNSAEIKSGNFDDIYIGYL